MECRRFGHGGQQGVLAQTLAFRGPQLPSGEPRESVAASSWRMVSMSGTTSGGPTAPRLLKPVLQAPHEPRDNRVPSSVRLFLDQIDAEPQRDGFAIDGAPQAGYAPLAPLRV